MSSSPRNPIGPGDTGGLGPRGPHKGFLQRAGKATFNTLCFASLNSIFSSGGGGRCAFGRRHSFLPRHTHAHPFPFPRITAGACPALELGSSFLGGPLKLGGGWQGVGFGGPGAAWGLLFNLPVPNLPVGDP